MALLRHKVIFLDGIDDEMGSVQISPPDGKLDKYSYIWIGCEDSGIGIIDKTKDLERLKKWVDAILKDRKKK